MDMLMTSEIIWSPNKNFMESSALYKFSKEKEVLQQSRAAMSQWEPIWRANAIENNRI